MIVWRGFHGVFSVEDTKALWDLEDKRRDLVSKEDATWRLRSRAIWIKQGDNNTIFFHHSTNHRKNINSIWEVHDPKGVVISSFKKKAEEGVRHFNNLFKDPQGCLIQEILHILQEEPRSIMVEMNDFLSAEVTEEELLDTLSSFCWCRVFPRNPVPRSLAVLRVPRKPPHVAL